MWAMQIKKVRPLKFHVWEQQVQHDHKAFQRLWRDTEYLGGSLVIVFKLEEKTHLWDFLHKSVKSRASKH